MKKTFLITILTLLTFNCKAQDIIESNKLTINGVNLVGQNKSILIASFGNPTEIKKDFSEMDNTDMYIYKYNGINLTIIENKVSTFRITNSNYKFTKHNIKVGDNISVLKSVFPISYSKKNNKGLLLWLKDYDKNLFISYNNFNIIDGITLYTY